MVVIVIRKKTSSSYFYTQVSGFDGDYEKLACKAVLISLSIVVSGLLILYFWGVTN